MSHGLKLLLIAAGAIITCIVVVVGFSLTKSGKSDTNQATEQYTSMIEGYDDVKLSSYDGITMSGSDVAGCIKECDQLLSAKDYSFSIVVKTLENTSGVYYWNAVDGKAALSPTPAPVKADYPSAFEMNTSTAHSTDDNYINPKGKFLGAVTRNDNGIITVLTFTQQR